MPQAASGDSSRNGESRSTSSSIRSRASSLPRSWCRSTYFGAAAGQRLGVLGVELGELGQHRVPVARVASARAGVEGGSAGRSQQLLRDVDVPGAQPLAERLGLRVEPGATATPSPSSPSTTKLSARRLRQHVPRRPAAGRLGQQLAAAASTVSVAGQPARTPRRCAPRPRVGVAALVARLRAPTTSAQRHAPGRPAAGTRPRGCSGSRRPVRPAPAGSRGRGGGGDRRLAVPSGSDRRRAATVGLRRRTPAVNTPYGVRVAGRGGQREARVGGQRQLDAAPRERPPGHGRVGVLDGARAAARSPPPRRRRPGGRCGPAASRAPRAGAERRLELRADQRGLGLDVEPGEHERHVVAEAAERVQRRPSASAAAARRARR